jgi:hypothetical protein
LKSLKNGPVQGAELELGLQMSGNKNWHVAYKYPMAGIGLHYNYLSYPDVLGYATGIYGFLEIPIFRTDNFELLYRITSGLTYLSEKYEEGTNEENIAISSWVNYVIYNGLRARYWVNDKTAIGVGTGLTHYSNGGTSKPNKGLNQLNIHMGVTQYLTGSYNKYSGARRPIVWDPGNEFYIMANVGNVSIYKGYGEEFTEYDPPKYSGTDQSYMTASLTIGWNYRYAAQRKVGLSIDCFYNESYNWTNWDNVFIPYHYSWEQLTRTGISINHEFLMNRLSILIAGGVYIIPSKELAGAMISKSKEWSYERLGLRYYPIKNMFINVSLKAYGFKAETIEIGLGFSLNSIIK